MFFDTYSLTWTMVVGQQKKNLSIFYYFMFLITGGGLVYMFKYEMADKFFETIKLFVSHRI